MEKKLLFVEKTLGETCRDRPTWGQAHACPAEETRAAARRERGTGRHTLSPGTPSGKPRRRSLPRRLPPGPGTAPATSGSRASLPPRGAAAAGVTSLRGAPPRAVRGAPEPAWPPRRETATAHGSPRSPDGKPSECGERGEDGAGIGGDRRAKAGQGGTRHGTLTLRCRQPGAHPETRGRRCLGEDAASARRLPPIGSSERAAGSGVTPSGGSEGAARAISRGRVRRGGGALSR